MVMTRQHVAAEDKWCRRLGSAATPRANTWVLEVTHGADVESGLVLTLEGSDYQYVDAGQDCLQAELSSAPGSGRLVVPVSRGRVVRELALRDPIVHSGQGLLPGGAAKRPAPAPPLPTVASVTEGSYCAGLGLRSA